MRRPTARPGQHWTGAESENVSSENWSSENGSSENASIEIKETDKEHITAGIKDLQYIQIATM